MAEYTFNTRLAQERKLTENDKKELQHLYNKLKEIFEVQRSYIENKLEPELRLLRAWDEMIRDIEFKLQEFWQFDKDEKYHHYWFEQPFCACPKMDNLERVGVGNFIINCECPVHGHMCKEIENEDQATGC